MQKEVATELNSEMEVVSSTDNIRMKTTQQLVSDLDPVTLMLALAIIEGDRASVSQANIWLQQNPNQTKDWASLSKIAINFSESLDTSLQLMGSTMRQLFSKALQIALRSSDFKAVKVILEFSRRLFLILTV